MSLVWEPDPLGLDARLSNHLNHAAGEFHRRSMSNSVSCWNIWILYGCSFSLLFKIRWRELRGTPRAWEARRVETVGFSAKNSSANSAFSSLLVDAGRPECPLWRFGAEPWSWNFCTLRVMTEGAGTGSLGKTRLNSSITRVRERWKNQ